MAHAPAFCVQVSLQQLQHILRCLITKTSSTFCNCKQPIVASVQSMIRHSHLSCRALIGSSCVCFSLAGSAASADWAPPAQHTCLCSTYDEQKDYNVVHT